MKFRDHLSYVVLLMYGSSHICLGQVSKAEIQVLFVMSSSCKGLPFEAIKKVSTSKAERDKTSLLPAPQLLHGFVHCFQFD